MEGGDKVERRRDRLALAAILHGVPEEMHTMMLSKKSVKEAWEAIKTMRLVADRVKEVNAQKLLAEFESITFKPGEAIDDFVVRIGKIASDLRGLGETSVNDARVVKKFLRAVPSRYNQVAVAIEMFSDLKTLSIEELVGRLRAGEDRFEPSVDHMLEKTGRLLLTARNKSRMVFDSSSSSGAARGGAGHYVKKDKQKGRGAHGGGDAREPKLTSMGTPRRRGKCKKCGIYGHWAKECKTQMKDERQDTALHVGADGEPALMVARVCNLVRTQGSEDKHVFLNQDHVFPTEYDDGAWVLDTGAMNHMTGNRESVHGAVRFGDGVESRSVGSEQ